MQHMFLCLNVLSDYKLSFMSLFRCVHTHSTDDLRYIIYHGHVRCCNRSIMKLIIKRMELIAYNHTN